MSPSRILLIGGGHSHIQVIKKFAMLKGPRPELVLISDVSQSPYSGMLPGWLGGNYSTQEMCFDLWSLCGRAGVVFVKGRVEQLDPVNKKVGLSDGREYFYDRVSVNVGIQPSRSSIQIDDAFLPYVLALKPISSLQKRLTEICDLLAQSNEAKSGGKSTREVSLTVVGGGASGFESAIALSEFSQIKMKVTLVTSAELLSGEEIGLIKKARRSLKEKGISLVEKNRVQGFGAEGVLLSSGEKHSCQILVLATGARAPEFIERSGLSTKQGFLEVNEKLQSLDDLSVFGAGDCIHFSPKPLPKAGVFAVRQGPILGENLFSKTQEMTNYRPQNLKLMLLRTGQAEAIGSYGKLVFSGKWVWDLKDSIDKNFMKRFSAEALPLMEPMEMVQDQNTCGGCGAKAPMSLLSNLTSTSLVGVKKFEDAGKCVIKGQSVFASVDGLRSFLGDSVLFGQIAAQHALGDLIAQGVQGRGALISLALPTDQPNAKFRMIEILQGIQSVCRPLGISILKGHTADSREESLHLSFMGELFSQELKGQNAQIGDQLILCKPLGIGSLLRAQMLGTARAKEMDLLLSQLQLLPAGLLEFFQKFDVKAVTDVTGFGLLGHLTEMLNASDLSAVLNRSQIPLFEGAFEAVQRGQQSHLLEKNRDSFGEEAKGLNSVQDALFFDPQTNGGFLICIEKTRANDALGELRRSGYNFASIIGEITPRSISRVEVRGNFQKGIC